MRRILEIASLIILRALFLYGYGRHRRGSTALATVILFYAVLGLWVSYRITCLAAVYSILFLALCGAPRLAPYIVLVSAIPSLWMSLTQLVIAIIKSSSLASALTVFLRAFTVSIAVITYLTTLNIYELYRILHRLSRSLALFVATFHRTVAELLKDGIEVLHSHRLKGVETWRTLAIAFLRGEEVSNLITESLITKTFASQPCPIPYDRQCLTIQLVGVLILTIATLAEILS